MRMSAAEFAARFPLHPDAKAITAGRSAKKKPDRIARQAGRSILEAHFALQVRAHKLPAPAEEYRFAPKRRWAFDFAWPGLLLAVEVEGGIYSQGRHVRPAGFQKDCEKYNEATSLGWLVLRYTAQDIKSGKAIDQVRALLEEKGRGLQSA